MLHQEVDGRAALTTGKALADLFRWRHHERRGLVIVKRTQALVVHTSLTEGNKLTHHINDVGGVHDFVYGSSVNHIRCKITKNQRIICILASFLYLCTENKRRYHQNEESTTTAITRTNSPAGDCTRLRQPAHPRRGESHRQHTRLYRQSADEPSCPWLYQTRTKPRALPDRQLDDA